MDDAGLKKSAILLMSLGEEEAASVFKFLSPKEVQKLGSAMSSLNNITQSEIETVIDEFNTQASGKTALGQDASDYIRKVLTNALGDEKAANLIARILETYSYTTDTPDFWRREYEYYPQHGGRFTGDPAYFKHVTGAAKGIMAKAGLKPSDFNYVIFHQPNGKFPFRVGKMLGFEKPQIEPGWLVNKLGNTYSGSSPLGLTASLDVSKSGDKILPGWKNKRQL